ncbi:hypothetical protein MP228_006492 [Amoeboaphelidium protococcarum]|nr:hypothetical protein MP228_006492 [Amoeboaphelidium protococcarum]
MSQRQSAGKGNIRLDVGELNRNNLGQAKAINSVVLPVKYSDKVYNTVLDRGHGMLAYFNDSVVGCITSFPADAAEFGAGGSEHTGIYIMSFCVLAAYRGYGVGSMLLQEFIKSCLSLSKDSADFISVHVQAGNESGKKFYEKSGFTVVDTVRDYYKDLPDGQRDAFLLRLALSSEVSKASTTH